MEAQQGREVDVDQLVAVQREQVALLAPRLRREADAPAPPQRLRLGDRDDLGAEAAERRLEGAFLAGRAADEHSSHAGGGQLLDLVGGQRPARELDERLRTPVRGLAEALGLAARQDDRFHYGAV